MVSKKSSGNGNIASSGQFEGLRVIPQALDVERQVLGAILLDSDAVGEAMELLKPEDFYLEKHQHIFRAASLLFSNSQPVDVLTLKDTLIKQQALEKAGGEAELVDIGREVFSSANIADHCAIVQEKAQMRKLISSANGILHKVYQANLPPGDIMDQAEQEIFALSEATVQQGLQPIRGILDETCRLIESYSKSEIIGCPSGLKDLDTLTSGFQKTDLIILAGRPAMGKTSLALSMMANAAINHGKSVAFFSLEMGSEQLVQRILCREAEINMHLLRTGRLPRRDYPKLTQAMGPVSQASIFIDDNPSLNILEMRAKCRRLKAQHGTLDMVMVDYLQLMRGVGRVDNREQEISQISRGLKALAKELQVPVMALSQLNRAVEHRGDGRPQMADLRESGAIEQDADLILFVFREEVYKKEEGEKGKAEVILAKQRNGPTGAVPLTFISDYASFRDYSPREVNEGEVF